VSDELPIVTTGILPEHEVAALIERVKNAPGRAVPLASEFKVMTRDMLTRMFDLQQEAQAVYYTGSWPTPDDATRMARISEAALALQVELAEALNETGWKPWATSNHLNREAFKGELVDVLKFWMNLCLQGGITPQEIYDGFVSKHYTNMARQAAGYDGVSTKCPGCKRAYDDPATRCQPASDSRGMWCAVMYPDPIG
jgi:hypothetical protein